MPLIVQHKWPVKSDRIHTVEQSFVLRRWCITTQVCIPGCLLGTDSEENDTVKYGEIRLKMRNVITKCKSEPLNTRTDDKADQTQVARYANKGKRKKTTIKPLSQADKHFSAPHQSRIHPDSKSHSTNLIRIDPLRFMEAWAHHICLTSCRAAELIIDSTDIEHALASWHGRG